MGWRILPCLSMALVSLSMFLGRLSYLPEASDVALDVAGYSLICMIPSVYRYLDLIWSIFSTEVWRWLPYQTSVHVSIVTVVLCFCT